MEIRNVIHSFTQSPVRCICVSLMLQINELQRIRGKITWQRFLLECFCLCHHGLHSALRLSLFLTFHGNLFFLEICSALALHRAHSLPICISHFGACQMNHCVVWAWRENKIWIFTNNSFFEAHRVRMTRCTCCVSQNREFLELLHLGTTCIRSALLKKLAVHCSHDFLGVDFRHIIAQKTFLCLFWLGISAGNQAGVFVSPQ